MYNDYSFTKDRLAFSMADALEMGVFVPSYSFTRRAVNNKMRLS